MTVTSVTDAEVNGIKMKKFEGKLTLAKSSSDTNTTWDCYIYGYVLEAGPKPLVSSVLSRNSHSQQIRLS